MNLTIATPERKTYDGEVGEVTLPTADGEITILPGHTSLVTQIQPGELIVKKEGKETNLAVGYGFAQINGTQVSVLTDLAEEVAEISEKEAEEARRRAEEALRNRGKLSSEEYAAIAAALQKSLARLRVRRRHYPKNTPKI